MASNHLFLIRYRLDAQARSVEVQSEAETLTPEQARFHLESLHTSALPAQITDVEVVTLADAGPAGAGQQLYP